MKQIRSIIAQICFEANKIVANTAHPSSTCRLLLSTQDPGYAPGPVEETRLGATQDSVVQTSLGEAQAQCVKRSECSTGLYRVGKSRISTVFCFQTSPDAEVASVVQTHSRCNAGPCVQTFTCTAQVSLLQAPPGAAPAPVFYTSPVEAQIPMVWTCPGATQASGNVFTTGDDSQELFQHIQDQTKDELVWQKICKNKVE